jgi:uncharacterized membrane protein YfcA
LGDFPVDYLILAMAALFAGLMDAVVGGGGLILIPALFGVFPSTGPATLFGTNKLAGIWGTAFAAQAYARRIRIEWGAALPAALAALLFSFVGAWAVTRFPPDLIRKSLPFILLLVAVYVMQRKDLGAVHAPRFHGMREKWLALGVGSGIGLYDGFFGPGTGSFLIFLFVRFFGFDFLGASAVSKIVNVACNLSALIWFGYTGHVFWQLGILMAALNIASSIIGTRLALARGSGFIRKAFLVVVTLLILKTAKDAFWF